MYAEARAARAKIQEEATKLDTRRAELDARQRLVAREAEQALAYVRDPKLAAWMEQVSKEQQPDEDSPEYPAFVGRQAALQTVKEFFGKLQEANATIQQQRAKQDEEAKRKEVVSAHTAYVQQHLDEFRNPEVLERVKVLMRRGISIEEAHRISMAERLATTAADTAELKRQAQEAARSRIRRGGRSDATATEPPKGLSAAERDEWYQAHPEAAKARLARYRQGAA